MKKFTLVLVACLCALGAMAHRDVYFGWGFAKKANLGHDSFSVRGADVDAEGDYLLLLSTGDYKYQGKNAVAITHDQTTHGEKSMPNLSEVQMTLVAGTDAGGAAHVTPLVVVTDAEGNRVSFNFDPIADNLELTQTVKSTGMVGDMSEMGDVKQFVIYFLGVKDDEMISPTNIYLCSGWDMPVVSPNHVATSKSYMLCGDGEIPPVVEEQGVTYIQAEDFDEPWINNRITHSRTGSNGMRLYPEDQNINIDPEGDGASYSKFVAGHGRVKSNRFKEEKSGYILRDFLPSGADWASYKGEYEEDILITTENAFQNWGAWAEFTFDVEEDCFLDLSISMACHRGTFDPMIRSTANWDLDPEDHGYLMLEDPDKTFWELYGFKVRTFLDDEIQRIAYDAQPEWNFDGTAFEREIIPNPAKWTNCQEVDANGKKVNSQYLQLTPFPAWGWDQPDDSPGTVVGGGWQPYMKYEMLGWALDMGLCSQEMYDLYAHPDYMDMPVKKGRHTIKVQNCGGMPWFDEIKITAKKDPNGAGIDNVLADGIEGALEGKALYFDFQGRQVINPAHGMYIVKRGSKVTKEVL